MNNLYNEIGKFVPENLINDARVDILTKAAKIKKGTELKRGTVLTKDKNGYHKKFNIANIETEKPDVILADDVNADEDVFVVTYMTGCFNKNALILDGELNDVAIEILREKGIFIKENMEVK